MVASHGSSVFTGTSGFFTFEFNATAVVDYGGWDVLITAASSGSNTSDTIYFTGTSEAEIWSAPVDGSGPATLLYDQSDGISTAGPVGIEVDQINGLLYFASGNDGEIYVAPADGSGPITLLPALGEGCCERHEFEIDYVNGLVYYTTDNNGLWVGNLDGTGLGTQVVSAVDVPGAVTLDETNGKLYFWNEDDDDIGVVNTDGSGLNVNLYDADFPRGITIDEATQTLYWLERNLGGGGVYTAPADGTGTPTQLYTLANPGLIPYGIDFDPVSGLLYWTEFENIGSPYNDHVIVAPADGSGTPTPLYSGDYGQIRGIAAGRNIEALAPLTNDTCANATAIACGQTLSGDTSDGDVDTNGDGSPDEWFAVTSSVAGELITVSTCNQAAFDTILTVYDSCGGAVVASNDDGTDCSGFTSELSFVADGSSTYFIAVDGFGGASGTFDLTISCGPVNDDPCGAIALECGVPVFGNTDTATDDTAAAPDCDTPTSANGIWYIYEDTSGLVTDILLSTCSASTDYDTKISVYTGDCNSLPLTCVAGNDDSPNCSNFQSEVEFQSDGNTTYYILVHGFGGATGNFELTMTCTPVPPPNDMIVNSIDVDEIGFPYTDPAVAMPAATTENGNPDGCNIDGGKGVWYNFTSAGNGTATASITSPAGASFVTFFKAPNEMAIETDLEYFFQVGNQCAPGTTANITTEAGQAYYLFVVNTGGVTDIVIDGTLLGVDENALEGFSFYPNPADNILNLTSVELIENVAIYNLLGQQVLERDINASSSELNISALATGAYLMKVSINGQIGTYKVIKR